MPFYQLDSSGLVKRYVDEVGSDWVRTIVIRLLQGVRSGMHPPEPPGASCRQPRFAQSHPFQ
jgi:hypothetical protein